MNDETMIADLLKKHTPQVQTLVAALRALIRAAEPDLTEEPKSGWGNLVYKGRGVVCAISPHKAHVNLNFYKGTSLDDSAGLLEGTGKALRHVKVRAADDIDEDALRGLLRQAVALDAES